MTNSLLVIFPYQCEEVWVFDDASTGLVREPFVCGVPEMIDHLVQDIPNAKQGFKLIFAGQPFPGFQEKLTWLRQEYEGNWYQIEGLNLEGWLCPALFKYFAEAPPEIYVKVEGKQAS